MSRLTERMVRAARLDPSLYEEVEADTGATGQALQVVVISSIAAGIGSIWESGLLGIMIATLSALVRWLVWAFLVFIVGTKLLPEPQTQSSRGELLRTIGFSSAPGIIRIGGIIPFLGIIVHVVAAIWMLIAMVIAVRQALDFKSTGRAVAVCVVGFLAYISIFALLAGVPVLLGVAA